MEKILQILKSYEYGIWKLNFISNLVFISNTVLVNYTFSICLEKWMKVNFK